MAVKDSYTKARAKKKSNPKIEINDNLTNNEKKNIVRKVKKSPILIIAILAIIIGAVIGFFGFTVLSPFEMNSFLVNGVESEETDYVIIDLSQIKEELLNSNPDITTDDLYSSINIEDKGVTSKFFGFDVSDTVNVEYYYREDISHDITQVDKIDLTTAGVYYIEYTSTHFAFKNTLLIRTIIVTEVENDG